MRPERLRVASQVVDDTEQRVDRRADLTAIDHAVDHFLGFVAHELGCVESEDSGFTFDGVDDPAELGQVVGVAGIRVEGQQQLLCVTRGIGHRHDEHVDKRVVLTSGVFRCARSRQTLARR